MKLLIVNKKEIGMAKFSKELVKFVKRHGILLVADRQPLILRPNGKYELNEINEKWLKNLSRTEELGGSK